MRTYAILGDSYSTYEGFNPQDYHAWYNDHGNAHPNDMKGVENTWWKLLENDLDLKLIVNSSYSGSTVCNTDYNGLDATIRSFVSRMKRDLGKNKDIYPEAEYIFFFGGTNDYWANVPVGQPKYHAWTIEDLYEFSAAFCYALDYLKKYNPNAVIINIVNDDIQGEIRMKMAEICKHYKVNNIELCNISKMEGHPDLLGMKQIKEQIEYYIKENAL